MVRVGLTRTWALRISWGHQSGKRSRCHRLQDSNSLTLVVSMGRNMLGEMSHGKTRLAKMMISTTTP